MSKLTWKRRIGRLFGGFSTDHRRTVILLYHSVGESALAVPEATFRQQVAWLAERAAFVPIGSVLDTEAKQGVQVAITFDDGYASLQDIVAPILAEYDAAATVYLNTGWIGETARKASNAALGHYPGEHFLNWREVEVLAKAGWTIGSHGVAHLDLTQHETAVVARELADSKREIESCMGKPCEHFAYTWGRFTPSLQHTVKNAGYLSAVSGLHGSILPASDRYALPRVDIRADYELRDFIDVVTGRWDYLGLKHRLERMLL